MTVVKTVDLLRSVLTQISLSNTTQFIIYSCKTFLSNSTVVLELLLWVCCQFLPHSNINLKLLLLLLQHHYSLLAHIIPKSYTLLLQSYTATHYNHIPSQNWTHPLEVDLSIRRRQYNIQLLIMQNYQTFQTCPICLPCSRT